MTHDPLVTFYPEYTPVSAHCTILYFPSSLDSFSQTLTSVAPSMYRSIGGIVYLSRTVAFPGKPGFDSGVQSWVRGWSWQVHSGHPG